MNAHSTAFMFILLLLLILSTSVAHADTNDTGAAQFDIISLQRPGVIFMADSGDLDGDGGNDLLLFHRPSKESYEKSCSVYFHDGKSYIADEPLEIQLGQEIGAICIADVDSDGRDELCAFDADGMVVFGLDEGRSIESKRALQERTILPAATRRMAAVNWIADADSDGRADVVLPLTNGFGLFLRDGDGGFAAAQTLRLPTRANVTGEGGQGYISYRLPAIDFSDFDGDGRTDIGAFDYEQMSFFLAGNGDAPHRFIASPLIRKFTKDFMGAADYSDLNADGVPDATLVLMSQKKNLQSEVRIYFGGSDLSYGDEPSNIYPGDTSLILPMFLDATGDGKMEMLLQNVDVGFGFFLNYFLRNRIRVDIELRKLDKNGIFEEEPMLRRAIYIRASETGAEPARGTGDFNGDGLDDLVVGTTEESLSFFLSDEETIMPRQPTFKLSVPAYGKLKILNLNGDARDDLIILYTQEDKLGTATLLLSR